MSVLDTLSTIQDNINYFWHTLNFTTRGAPPHRRVTPLPGVCSDGVKLPVKQTGAGAVLTLFLSSSRWL